MWQKCLYYDGQSVSLTYLITAVCSYGVLIHDNTPIIYSIMSYTVEILVYFQKPANILVMGEGEERGRVKIGI